MITILTGAKKNIGDFLIGDRAKKLLKKYVDDEILELDRFQNLEPYLDQINNSKCLILCGGPAYAKDIYGGIFPLVDDLSKIKVPIIPFGIGWSGKPFKNPERFKFEDKSKQFVTDIHKTIEYSSCRDVLTHEILKQNGIENALMTGCPVWYDLDHINTPFRKGKEIKKIVFSNPASTNLIGLTVSMMKMVRKNFPKSTIYFCFHRGIGPDKHTGIRKAIASILLALAAKLSVSNVKIVDVAYELKKIDFYQDCDFHIGYRVHAHLLFLSKRIPSMLVNEDGRGLGMIKSMNLPEFNVGDANLVSKMDEVLKDYIKNDFSAFDAVQSYIDHQFKIMQQFLESMKKVG